MSIAGNLANIAKNIPLGVKLIAVSKMRSIEAIKEAYALGQRDFGESRPQELEKKAAELPNDIQWHFIGHLQSNKIKLIIPYAYLVHSIDSIRLLESLNNACEKQNKNIKCLLQVHIAREYTKQGFSQKEILNMIPSIKNGEYKHIELSGLMGMSTNTTNEEIIRKEFHQLKQLQLTIQEKIAPIRFSELSMGMSNDYHIAIEEGSTMVRVGSAIFGER
jgi:pyridoxal phosphate enzyme (YggS family)